MPKRSRMLRLQRRRRIQARRARAAFARSRRRHSMRPGMLGELLYALVLFWQWRRENAGHETFYTAF